jgi:hypothetical protein
MDKILLRNKQIRVRERKENSRFAMLENWLEKSAGTISVGQGAVLQNFIAQYFTFWHGTIVVFDACKLT